MNRPNCFTIARSQWDFESLHEYFSYVESHELRTLQGELVRSFEELEIANWLCMNGIAYQYEPVYERELPPMQRAQDKVTGTELDSSCELRVSTKTYIVHRCLVDL